MPRGTTTYEASWQPPSDGPHGRNVPSGNPYDDPEFRAKVANMSYREKRQAYGPSRSSRAGLQFPVTRVEAGMRAILDDCADG